MLLTVSDWKHLRALHISPWVILDPSIQATERAHRTFVHNAVGPAVGTSVDGDGELVIFGGWAGIYLGRELRVKEGRLEIRSIN